MKKYLKITLLVVIAIILVGTFVFLYQKSKPKVITYETVRPEMTDLQKTSWCSRRYIHYSRQHRSYQWTSIIRCGSKCTIPVHAGIL